jgi:hypothetical protein
MEITSTYEPFTHLFLLPEELKTRYKSLTDLIEDEKLIKGNFELKAPQSYFGFKTELNKMKLAAQLQTKFSLRLIHSKNQMEFFSDQLLKSMITEFSRKKQGRPLSLKKRREKKQKIFKFLAENLMSHDCQFAIAAIDNTIAKRLHKQKKQFKQLLGNKVLDYQSFFPEKLKLIRKTKQNLRFFKIDFEAEEEEEPEDLRKKVETRCTGTEVDQPIPRMKDVSTTNVCQMIDFGHEIQSLEDSDKDSLRVLTQELEGDAMEDYFMNDMCLQTNETAVLNKFTQVDF